MLRALLPWATAAVMALAPAAVHAQSAVDPTLDCTVVRLRIMGPEMGGAHLACRVGGVPVEDSTFTISATQSAPGPNQPVQICVGNLSSGAGECRGSFVDRANGALGQLSFTATVQPSGTTLGPVSLGPASEAATTPPMEFFPLPEN